MAGRGVDIILGGEPPENVKDLPAWEEKASGGFGCGGLFVIGTERHEREE